MADAPDTAKPDYRSTVFLPRTDFPMKAGLPQKEPAIAARWDSEGLYKQIRAARANPVRGADCFRVAGRSARPLSPALSPAGRGGQSRARRRSS